MVPIGHEHLTCFFKKWRQLQERHIEMALLVLEYQIGWLWQTMAAHWATSSEIWRKKEEYKMQNQNKSKMAAAKSVTNNIHIISMDNIHRWFASSYFVFGHCKYLHQYQPSFGFTSVFWELVGLDTMHNHIKSHHLKIRLLIRGRNKFGFYFWPKLVPYNQP